MMRVKTKIVATLGPASSHETMLRQMFLKGLDVVRLNFSHGRLNEHLHRIELVRSLNKRMRRAIKIMQDLEGYRIRLGRLKKEVLLDKNAVVYLTQEDIIGDDKQIPFDYAGSLKIIKPGSLIYIDDGKILLKVIARASSSLKMRVITKGLLKERKGVNILGAKLKFKALTQKDKKDLAVAIKYRLDYVAQSFVSKKEDIRLLKDILYGKHSDCKVFAKVENQQALRNIDEIINEADGIIIARGDLGVCIPIYKVPVIQKEIIKKCRLRNKPVIVATQMLDSMTENAMPTRAEVSDVANAILDGADMLLLSAETAVGKYPSTAIDMMNKIIKNTEIYENRLKWV